eukprot:821298-Prorocentrum_lima.AAC.1
MTSSLVGSEMCIRDSPHAVSHDAGGVSLQVPLTELLASPTFPQSGNLGPAPVPAPLWADTGAVGGLFSSPVLPQETA